MLETSKVAFAKIHPAIGVARVGNHPSGYFIGPERPWDESVPAGGYKAEHQGTPMVKRQAARFRVYGYDAQGKLVGELDKHCARIRWSLALANRKAAWERFSGPRREPLLRNPSVPIDRRGELVIGPLHASLPADSAGVARLEGGKFLAFKSASEQQRIADILLGELHVDDEGRALVLAGLGRAGSPVNMPLVHYANNDGWFDDIADGPLDASVELREGDGGRAIPVTGAWVITAPPNYAPQVQAIVSLYDMLRDRAIREGVLARPQQPSFAYDIYPLIDAALRTRAVYAQGGAADHAYHFFASLRKPDAPLPARKGLLAHMRVPKSLRGEYSGGLAGNMPMLRDASDDWHGDGRKDIGFSVTPTQYRLLAAWAEGRLRVDAEHGSAPKPSAAITPRGLDRAALMSCIGGPFYPGIEVGWFLESDKAIDMAGADYLRVDRGQLLFGAKLGPGDLTKHMALPWQADFYKCTKYGSEEPGWWPSARPNEVRVAAAGGQGGRASWTREHVESHDDMVARWWKLGFVVGDHDDLIECQRNPT